jgi:hypothetical protein
MREYRDACLPVSGPPPRRSIRLGGTDGTDYQTVYKQQFVPHGETLAVHSGPGQLALDVVCARHRAGARSARTSRAHL